MLRGCGGLLDLLHKRAKAVLKGTPIRRERREKLFRSKGTFRCSCVPQELLVGPLSVSNVAACLLLSQMARSQGPTKSTGAWHRPSVLVYPQLLAGCVWPFWSSPGPGGREWISPTRLGVTTGMSLSGARAPFELEQDALVLKAGIVTWAPCTGGWKMHGLWCVSLPRVLGEGEKMQGWAPFHSSSASFFFGW